jgi:hypothetical protein
MLLLNNERELTRHLVARASQHVVEEVCGVGVAVGPFMMAHSGLDRWLLGGIN